MDWTTSWYTTVWVKLLYNAKNNVNELYNKMAQSNENNWIDQTDKYLPHILLCHMFQFIHIALHNVTVQLIFCSITARCFQCVLNNFIVQFIRLVQRNFILQLEQFVLYKFTVKFIHIVLYNYRVHLHNFTVKFIHNVLYNFIVEFIHAFLRHLTVQLVFNLLCVLDLSSSFFFVILLSRCSNCSLGPSHNHHADHHADFIAVYLCTFIQVLPQATKRHRTKWVNLTIQWHTQRCGWTLRVRVNGTWKQPGNTMAINIPYAKILRTSSLMIRFPHFVIWRRHLTLNGGQSSSLFRSITRNQIHGTL